MASGFQGPLPTARHFLIERPEQLVEGMLFVSPCKEPYLLWEIRARGGNAIVLMGAPVLSSCEIGVFPQKLAADTPTEPGVYRFFNAQEFSSFAASVPRPPLHVLKVINIPGDHPAYDANVARMRHEGALFGEFSHPSLPMLVGCGSEPFPHLILELLLGQTLQDILNSSGTPFHTKQDRLGWRVITEVMASLADVVSLLHRAKIIHRDLKPGNIILQARGSGRYSVCLVDLGVARRLGEGESDVGGLTGILGLPAGYTPEFAAPEQAIPGAKVGPWTDVYALGCILYAASEGLEALSKVTGADPVTQGKSFTPCTHPSLEPELLNSVTDLIDERTRHPEAKNPGGMCALDPKLRPSLEELVKRLRTVEDYRTAAAALKQRRS